MATLGRPRCYSKAYRQYEDCMKCCGRYVPARFCFYSVDSFSKFLWTCRRSR
jgi:hypothetical protein